MNELQEIKGVSKSTNGKFEQPCRVDYMINLEGDTAYFYYTPWGDPEKIEMSRDPSTGEPNFYFVYDKNKRLVEFQAAYVKDLRFEKLMRFYYRGNTVLKDSVFNWADIDDLYHFSYWEGKYLYDRYNRIIEYNYIVYDGTNGEVTQKYLDYEYPNENPYIDNRNYWAGNRVLMFVSKYYDKTTPAESYNSLGYPIHFAEFQEPSLFCCASIKEIVYDCSGLNKTQPQTQ
jgi:hypothetical protein